MAQAEWRLYQHRASQFRRPAPTINSIRHLKSWGETMVCPDEDRPGPSLDCALAIAQADVD